MSHGYGFLTQSSIIPKKSKQIKINDNSGQLLLQSIIQKQKQRLKSGKKNQSIISNEKVPKRNKGIQQRMKKDEQQSETIKLSQKNIYKCLQNKANVYDKLATRRTNVSKLLTDFEAKDLQMNKKQADQFQKDRAAFYNGLIKNVQQQQNALHQNIQTQKHGMSQMRERLQFQKQALNQLKGDTIQINTKPKVIQSFDNKFSKEQKQAFEKVLNQEEQQKLKIESIRKRKQQMQQQRLRKLRKLNIISDVCQAARMQKKQEEESQQR